MKIKLRGGSRGPRGPGPPPRPPKMRPQHQNSTKLRPQNGSFRPVTIWAPPPRSNPGSGPETSRYVFLKVLQLLDSGLISTEQEKKTSEFHTMHTFTRHSHSLHNCLVLQWYSSTVSQFCVLAIVKPSPPAVRVHR